MEQLLAGENLSRARCGCQLHARWSGPAGHKVCGALTISVKKYAGIVLHAESLSLRGASERSYLRFRPQTRRRLWRCLSSGKRARQGGRVKFWIGGNFACAGILRTFLTLIRLSRTKRFETLLFNSSEKSAASINHRRPTKPVSWPPSTKLRAPRRGCSARLKRTRHRRIEKKRPKN